MGRPMDPRRLTGPAPERLFGRRATDSASTKRFYAAAFVAQVAGSSLPGTGGAGAYRSGAPTPPAGIVADLSA